MDPNFESSLKGPEYDDNDLSLLELATNLTREDLYPGHQVKFRITEDDETKQKTDQKVMMKKFSKLFKKDQTNKVSHSDEEENKRSRIEKRIPTVKSEEGDFISFKRSNTKVKAKLNLNINDELELASEIISLPRSYSENRRTYNVKSKSPVEPISPRIPELDGGYIFLDKKIKSGNTKKSPRYFPKEELSDRTNYLIANELEQANHIDLVKIKVLNLSQPPIERTVNHYDDVHPFKDYYMELDRNDRKL